MKGTGPTVYSPYPRRLESLTICWCNYKGSTFSSVIFKTLSVGPAGVEITTSRVTTRCSINWATGARCMSESYIEMQIRNQVKLWSSRWWWKFSQLSRNSFVWFISYIILVYWFIHHGNIWTHKWPAPTIFGFIAQLVRASAWHCEVAGANHVEVPSFSDFSMQLLRKIVFITVRSIASLAGETISICDAYWNHHLTFDSWHNSFWLKKYSLILKKN